MPEHADHAAAVEKVQLLLSALFLEGGEEVHGLMHRAPGEWVAEWLGLEPTDHFGPNALRHLVAVLLAPRSAIAYDPTDPTPRWRLIDAHLAAQLALDDADRELIA